LAEVQEQVLARWRASEGKDVRSLKLDEEQLNLFLRSMLRQPEASSLLSGIHDVYLKPGSGRLEVKGSFYGNQVARLLPKQGVAPELAELLAGAEFLNVELGLEVLPGKEGEVRVKPDYLRVLGLSLPVVLLQGLAAQAGFLSEQGGYRVPGLRRLQLQESGVTLEMAAGSWLEK
jgi:hypothetical protein